MGQENSTLGILLPLAPYPLPLAPSLWEGRGGFWVLIQ